MARVIDVTAYHYQDERSDKIWGYTRVQENSGDLVTYVFWGRRGKSLTAKAYYRGASFGSSKAREKLRKGYVEIPVERVRIPQLLSNHSVISSYHRSLLGEYFKTQRPPARLAAQLRRETSADQLREPAPNNAPESGNGSVGIDDIDLSAGIVMLQIDSVDEETEE